MNVGKESASALRPYHETVVAAIGRATSSLELGVLVDLLVETLVPKEVGAVIKAWCDRLKELDLDPENWHPEVLTSLSEQKRQHERKTVL
ncbi:TPA: hypothetical protein DEP86_03590 [Candidatus Uhrbacteria bacterium]|nr:hypothetical protein [Candidatus Uhrbacteria bacterium]